MHLRLGLLFGLAFVGTFAACSSEVSVNPGTQPDASTPVDASTTTDAGTTIIDPTEAGTDAGGGVELGAPITATAGQWTYVPFDDSSCANGSPTGIGINPGTSKRLVIYMEGGGACWDSTTCYSFQSASNLDGWDEAKFKTRIAATAKSHLDRNAADNPYKDASFVYIPYCTGDVHGGDKEGNYDGQVTKHFGRRNVEAFMKRIAPTFEDADRVVLTGSSAGGFGAAISYWRVKKYFGDTRVDLVDDSGPPFPNDKMKYFTTWLAAWDLQGAIDPGCTACADGKIDALLPYYSKTYPDARFSLLSYDHDPTISLFFNLTKDEFATTLASVTTTNFDPLTNMRVFEVSGAIHTMLGDLGTMSGTKELGSWLNDMNSDSATWTSVKPAEK